MINSLYVFRKAWTSQHLFSSDNIARILLLLASDSTRVDHHCSWDEDPIACNQMDVPSLSETWIGRLASCQETLATVDCACPIDHKGS